MERGFYILFFLFYGTIILEHLFYYNANLVKQVRNLNPNSIIIEIVHGSFNNKFLGDYVVVVYKDVKFKQEYYLYSLLLPDNFASNLDIEFYSQPLDYHYLLAQEQVKIIDTAGVALKKQIELYKFYIQKNNLNCELFYNLKSNFCMLVTGASNQFLRYYLEKESILLEKESILPEKQSILLGNIKKIDQEGYLLDFVII